MKRNNKKGFTIVELVIVIAVIGILAAVLIPTFSNAIAQANAAAELQEARNAYTKYLTTVDLKDGVPTVDYVKVGTNYYDVDNEYAIDTDGKVCGYVLTVAENGTASLGDFTHNGTAGNDGYCDNCRPAAGE